MREKINEQLNKVNGLMADIMGHHVGAYAAQSSLFFLISMFPIIMLLVSLVQMTSVTKADLLTVLVQIFPSSVSDWITDIVNEIYLQSAVEVTSIAVLPTVLITVLITLWAAGKAVMAITSGLNSIYQCEETRSYVFIRIRAAFYTLLILMLIALALVLSFGNELTNFLEEYNFVAVENVLHTVLSISTYGMPIIMALFILLVYRFLPNRKDSFFHQLPGAVFTAIGWLFFSWIISIYMDIFPGFSATYGSLYTIVLVLLWLYFIMYILLLGAELNRIVFTVLPASKESKDAQEAIEEKKEERLEDGSGD